MEESKKTDIIPGINSGKVTVKNVDKILDPVDLAASSKLEETD